MLDTFILGLSTGSACLLTCGMVIFPYLMSGASGTRKIFIDVCIFLLTRLIVYTILATLAWYFGKTLFISPVFRNYISGILYIVFAAMLVWYSMDKNRRPDCPAKLTRTISNKKLVPLFLGVVNSLGFCPALLIILTKSATQSSISSSYLAFLGFFIGSSLYFLPLPLAGRIRKRKIFETIGVLATGLAGVIFLIKGLTNIIGGIING